MEELIGRFKTEAKVKLPALVSACNKYCGSNFELRNFSSLNSGIKKDSSVVLTEQER